MDDIELLRSAGLYGTDYQTGIQGLNLAAVMLLGKDDVITNVTPAYETDCILRRVNIDRYDDREVVITNLVDSYFRIVLDYTDDTLKYTDETVNAPIECTDAPIKCTDQLEDKIDRQIVEYMQKKPRIPFTELTEATGFSRRAIAVHVKSLAERHIIARKGNNKNGYWEVHLPMS